MSPVWESALIARRWSTMIQSFVFRSELCVALSTDEVLQDLYACEVLQVSGSCGILKMRQTLRLTKYSCLFSGVSKKISARGRRMLVRGQFWSFENTQLKYTSRSFTHAKKLSKFMLNLSTRQLRNYAPLAREKLVKLIFVGLQRYHTWWDRARVSDSNWHNFPGVWQRSYQQAHKMVHPSQVWPTPALFYFRGSWLFVHDALLF